MVGYDDLYSVQYFGNNLRPWWNSNGNQTMENQLTAAANNMLMYCSNAKTGIKRCIMTWKKQVERLRRRLHFSLPAKYSRT